MNSQIALWKIAAGILVATQLAACTSDGKWFRGTGESDVSPAAANFGKLAKGLTTAQVSGMFGPPATTKPLAAGGVHGEIWSYPLRTTEEARSVPFSTQEIPATNPLTGQSITRTETVYQNETVNLIDTLHLLIVDGRLVEWRIVREEKGQFH